MQLSEDHRAVQDAVRAYVQDRIAPHKTTDLMAGARFEIPESVVNSRKSIRLRIEDVDGTSAEITE